MEKAVTTAERLLRQDRYAEAIKLLVGQNAQYGKAPKFRETLENIRQRQQAVYAVSVLKENVRDALSNADIARAKALCQEFRKSGNASDIVLVEKEIEDKQAQVANAKLEMALRDVERGRDAAAPSISNGARIPPLVFDPRCALRHARVPAEIRSIANGSQKRYGESAERD